MADGHQIEFFNIKLPIGARTRAPHIGTRVKILLTGAAGFIGSHIARALLEDGIDVRGLDDLSAGTRNNLPHPSSAWEFVLGDIRNPQVCRNAMQGVQAVVHLAARNSVPRSISDPRSAMEVNVVGGFNLLEAARAERVEHFVFASSSSVYGDNPTLPKKERQRACPLSPYAASKGSFEQFAHAWTASWGLHTVGLRLFNVFGPRQNANCIYAAVVPSFILAALSRERPVIHGDGTFTRDFTYIDNVVDAVRRALRAPDSAAGSVLNIACGAQVSVLDLWRSIAAATDFDAEPHFAPVRRGDMPHSRADISEAATVLGFAPVTPFEEGIARTVAWFRDAKQDLAA